MKKIICLVLCMAVILPLTACKNKKSSPQNQTIYYNLQNDPKTLDPQISDDISSLIVVTNIFEGLTKIDENNKVVPAAALSWEHNDDYTSYTFNLRRDSFWSDKEKTPVTANDFEYGIKRAIGLQTKSVTAENLFSIKNAKSINSGKMPDSELGVNVPDDYTIVFNLEYSFEDFPRLMAQAVSMPCNKNFFESTNGKYGLEGNFILCNGPFKMKSKYGWEHGKNLHIVNNENYSGAFKAIPLGVSFSIGEDTYNTLECIKKGKIDAGLLPGEMINEAKKLNCNLVSFEDTTWVLCFNFSDDIFKNSNVRKSFAQSFSREYVLKDIKENCKPAEDIILNNAMVDGKNYRDLVGGGLYLHEDENPKATLSKGLKQLNLKSLPTVTIICTEDSKTKSFVSGLLEQWNKNLGYYFNMQPVSKGKLSDTLELGQFKIALAPITVKSDDPIEPLSFFKTNDRNNLCDMKDSYYDKLLDKAIDSTAQEKPQSYFNAEKYLNDVAAVYPLYYENRYFASSNKVTGILFYSNTGTVSFVNAKKVK